MSDTGKGAGALGEFRDFLGFLQNLWGILAGVSVFFPLSNTLMKILPIGNIYDEPPGSGAFQHLSPELITSVATLVTLFVVLSAFGRRRRYRSLGARAVRRRAWASFAAGLACLVAYLVANYGIYELVYGPLEIWGGDPRRLLGDVFLLLAYCAFFALVTRAFMLLGMIEFYALKDAT